MAKIRTVKPSFFMSRAVKRLNDKQKLVWQGLWPNADDEGRLVDEPGILVGQLWALSVTETKLDVILGELDAEDRIIRYEIAGEGYIQVTNWHEHQKISRPAESVIPPVPDTFMKLRQQRRDTAATVLRHGGKGKERKGKEGEALDSAEPPLFCLQHITNPTAGNCRPCGDARRVHTAWVASQKNRPTVPGIITEDDCELHPGRPARGCDRCAEERKQA